MRERTGAEATKGDAVLVESGEFKVDMESRERLLKSEEKKLLKERIAQFFYNESGEPRFFPAVVTGVFVVSLIVGFFYGIGRIVCGISDISPNDPIMIFSMGFVGVVSLFLGIVICFGIGKGILSCFKKKEEE